MAVKSKAAGGKEKKKIKKKKKNIYQIGSTDGEGGLNPKP